ncbi:MAG: hypothetical protein J2P25_00775 [Nocardiopsaceae bacterium]|nr:hypothetical protein [Nocardiopsaceae bacterium]
MDIAISGVIGLAGTIIGAALTYIFQERSARRAEASKLRQELRAERRNVYSAFLTSLSELERSELDRYHRRTDARDSEAAITARAESFRLKSIAQAALSQVRLVAESAELTAAAEDAWEETRCLHAANDQGDLSARNKRSAAAVDRFTTLASAEVQAGT